MTQTDELVQDLLEDNKALTIRVNNLDKKVKAIEEDISSKTWFLFTFAIFMACAIVALLAFSFVYVGVYKSKQCFEHTKDSRCFLPD